MSDTRLRDVLRALGGRSGVVSSPAVSGDARFTLPSRAELDAHALETTVFEQAELVRYTRWADEIAARIAPLESRAGSHVRSRRWASSAIRRLRSP